MEDLALALPSQGDECFALISAANAAELGPTLNSFVAVCSRPPVPDTGIGVSLGAVDLDLDQFWHADADDDAVVRARALARIAANNQVLVDAATRDAMSIVDGFIPASPDRPRHLFGVRERVVVFVAPWGDVERTEIWNLALLRPELKRLENHTAETLIRLPKVGLALDAFGAARSDTTLRTVRTGFKRVVTRVNELQNYFNETEEVSRLPSFVASLTALQGAAAALLPACEKARLQLGTEQAETTMFDLTEPWDAVGDVLRNIHVAADKLIMEVDDGLANGQPAGWRY